MRIVFFGTPEFAVPSLETLLARDDTVVAAVTQPDRPRGRSRSTLEPPPIKTLAARHGIPVLQPERPDGATFLDQLRALAPDLGVVVAYGHILKSAVLAVPRHGMINVHASLLPHLRGAAPSQWAILRGDRETGVTVMQMEKGLDSGPVIDQVGTPIGPDETGGQLSARLAQLGAAALGPALDAIRDGRGTPRPQDHARATFAPKFDRDAARIVWTETAEQCACRIRAFDPSPGAWTEVAGSSLKCFSPRVVDGSGQPGTVLEAGDRLVVAAGTGAVAIGEVQPAGGHRMPAAAWLHGHRPDPGVRFE